MHPMLRAMLAGAAGDGGSPGGGSATAATGVLEIGTGIAGTTYSVTGLGFQPRIVVFAMSGNASATNNTGDAGDRHANKLFGVALSATERACVATQTVNDAATMATDHIERTDACVATITHAASAAVDGLADLQSMDADGFTLVIDQQFSTAERVVWWALGGAGITDAALVSFTEPGSTGNQGVTGAGFQPDAVILFGCDSTAANTLAGDSQLMVGIGVAPGGTVAQAVVAGKDDDARGDSVTGHYTRADTILAGFEATGPLSAAVAVDARASLASLDADGFTLTWAEQTARARRYWALAIKGGTWHVGSTTLPNGLAVGGTHAATGVPFTASSGFLLGANDVESTVDTETRNDVVSVGFFAGTASQASVGVGSYDGSASANCRVTIAYDAAHWLPRGFAGYSHRFAVTAISSSGYTLTHESGGEALPVDHIVYHLLLE